MSDENWIKGPPTAKGHYWFILRGQRDTPQLTMGYWGWPLYQQVQLPGDDETRDGSDDVLYHLPIPEPTMPDDVAKLIEAGVS
jgi:hypothetical protein